MHRKVTERAPITLGADCPVCSAIGSIFEFPTITNSIFWCKHCGALRLKKNFWLICVKYIL